MQEKEHNARLFGTRLMRAWGDKANDAPAERNVSETLEQIKKLAASGDLRIFEHGYDETAEDGIGVREILAGVQSAVLVELQSDEAGRRIHGAWGIPTPYLTPEDACKFDDVRAALKRGDVHAAAGHACIFEMRPVGTQ